jgi:hypothetical protein
VDWGDFSCDNRVDARDALTILRFVVGKGVQNGNCPPVGLPVEHDGVVKPWGDIDCSGEVDLSDVVWALFTALTGSGEDCLDSDSAAIPTAHSPVFVPSW